MCLSSSPLSLPHTHFPSPSYNPLRPSPLLPTLFPSLPSCPARPVASALWWQGRQLPLLLFSPPTTERTSRIPRLVASLICQLMALILRLPTPSSRNKPAGLSRRFFVYLPYQIPPHPPFLPSSAPCLPPREDVRQPRGSRVASSTRGKFSEGDTKTHPFWTSAGSSCLRRAVGNNQLSYPGL